MKTPLERRNEIHQYISKNDYQRAILILFELIEELGGNAEFKGEAIVISSEFNDLKARERQNIIDQNFRRQNLNRIAKQILQLTEEVYILLHETYKKGELAFDDSNPFHPLDQSDEDRSLLFQSIEDSQATDLEDSEKKVRALDDSFGRSLSERPNPIVNNYKSGPAMSKPKEVQP